MNLLKNTVNTKIKVDKMTESTAESGEAAEKAGQNFDELIAVMERLIKASGNSGTAFDSLNKLISVVNKKTGEERITKTVEVLTNIYSVLNQDVSDSSFIKALEEISKAGENLPAMAEILTRTKKQIADAKVAITKPEAKEDAGKEQLSEIKGKIKALSQLRKEYYSRMSREGYPDDDEFIRRYESQEGDLRASVDKIRSVFGDSSDAAKEATDALNTYNTASQQYATQYLNGAKAIFESLSERLDGGGLTEEAISHLEDAKSKVGAIISALEEHNSDEDWNPTKLQEYVRNLEEAKEALKSYKSNSDKLANAGGVTNMAKKIQDILSNTSIRGNTRAQLEDFVQELNDAAAQSKKLGNNLAGMPKARLSEIAAEVNKIEAGLKESGQDVKTFSSRFSEALSNQGAQWLARFFSFQDLIRYGRQAAQVVITVDSALTELRKVSDASNERLQQSFQKSAQTAQELGATISDVINATSDWARLGYNVDQAEELARVTTLFQTVGDNMTQESATQSLVSTLQGYKLDYTQAERVVDSINEVSNNFAIDTAGIGDALQRSAAAFAASGTDLNKSIALVTTANAVVQDPSSVGTIFKTLSARIRGQWWPIHNESCGPRCVIFAA